MRQFINFPNGVGKYKNFKSLELAGSDQSPARYIAFAELFNAALVAEPGGVSVDVAETLVNIEITNI